MKKFLLKCLLLGLCIGAVESEIAIKGSEVEPTANTPELVTYNDLQPEPKSSTLGTGGNA